LAGTFAKLVKEVMEQIAAVLTDSRKLTFRYGLVSEDDSAGSKLLAFLKPVQKSRLSFPLQKLRWSVVDKTAFAQIIADLSGFNDALKLFIPPRQRLGLDLALPL
jgi:hypothetical protein